MFEEERYDNFKAKRNELQYNSNVKNVQRVLQKMCEHGEDGNLT